MNFHLLSSSTHDNQIIEIYSKKPQFGAFLFYPSPHPSPLEGEGWGEGSFCINKTKDSHPVEDATPPKEGNSDESRSGYPLEGWHEMPGWNLPELSHSLLRCEGHSVSTKSKDSHPVEDATAPKEGNTDEF